MKQVMIAACAAVLCVSTSTYAQKAQPTVTETKVEQAGGQDEARALSGQLKEAYGMLSQEMAMLDREMGPDAVNATPAQLELREKMKTSIAQLEGSLSAVNTAPGADWKEVTAKAEGVRTTAMSMVAERKNARENK